MAGTGDGPVAWVGARVPSLNEIVFFCMERRLWSHRARSTRDIQVLRARSRRYPRPRIPKP